MDLDNTLTNPGKNAENTDINVPDNYASEDFSDDGGNEGEIYTKDDVTNIVKKRVERFAAKNAALSEQLENARSEAKKYGAISSALKANGIVSDEEQRSVIANALGINLTDTQTETKATSRADAYVDVQQFLKTATDEEVIDEYETLFAKQKKSPQKFGDNDSIRMSEIRDRYLDIKFREDMKTAEKYCTENKIDFKKLLSDDDFSEFVRDLNVPVSKAVKKYAKLKNLQGGDTGTGKNEKTQHVSTGSVKDSGPSTAKDFYSRDEVAKMSREEISKNMDVIHRSVKRW